MKKELKFYHSVATLIITVAAMKYIGAPLQNHFGMTGLALTEIMFGLIALLAVVMLRADFKEIFPFKAPPVSMFFSSLTFYVGVYLVNIALNSVISELFPASNEFSESITAFATTVSPTSAVVIIAILPAVFEELLHRGVILAGLKRLHHTWAIVLCAGIAFGIFHLDLYRFLPTAVLGCALAYICIKTESLLINMIMHFINNIISVIAIFSLSGMDISEVEQTADVSIWPAVIYLAIIGAVLVMIGIRKMNKVSETTQQQ